MTRSLRTNSFVRLFIALAVCTAALGLIGLFSEPRPAHAQSTSLSGYMWSDTIGWISVSGTGYGLTMDASGYISGYAWSENIGWVSAEAADVAGCPVGTCAPRISGGTSSGWLKAIAANGNGWDGWISLNCANGSTCATVNYGVTSSSGVYGGYAWGSDVVGWIDFSYVTPPPPTCSLTPGATTIVRGTNTSLDWTSTNATSGTITVIGNVSAAGSAAVNPIATTTYNATFGGSGGYGACQTTINVQCAPIYSCSGQTIQYTNAGCVTTDVTTCSAPSMCVAGQSSCINPPPEFTAGATTTGHLEVHPQLVRKGLTTHLYWNLTNVTSCTVTGDNGDSWATTSSGSGGQLTSPIDTTVIYTLVCNALTGVDPTTISESVTVVASPTFQEQ